MPYTRPYAGGFKDFPDTTTPINATTLNTMDVGIKTANDQFQTVTTAQRTALTPTVGQCVWDSDLRQLMVYMNASGGNAWQPIGNRIICTSTTRPATPFHGQVIYETDSKKEFVYNGTAWVQTNTTSTTSGVTGVSNLIVPPLCIVPLATTVSVANATDTAFAFGTASVNTDMTITAGTSGSTYANAGKIQVNTTGLYQVSYSITCTGNATGVRRMTIALNGTGSPTTPTGYGWAQIAGNATAEQTLSASFLMSLTSGNYVQVAVSQSSGGPLNFNNYAPGAYISLAWVGRAS